jgi:hypothetical protein
MFPPVFAKVDAVTVPPEDEEVPLLKFVAVPLKVVAVTVPPEEEEIPLLKFVAVVTVNDVLDDVLSPNNKSFEPFDI